jgi:hypothetical protein
MYGVRLGATMPRVFEAMLMTRPHPFSRIAGANCRVTKNWESRLMLWIRRQVAKSVPQKSLIVMTPALLRRMSVPSNAASNWIPTASPGRVEGGQAQV